MALDPVQCRRITQVHRFEGTVTLDGSSVHVVQAPIRSRTNSAAGPKFKVRAGCTAQCPAEF